MKEFFGKGFGFMAGLYTALVMTQVVDDKLPEKYKLYKEKRNSDGKGA